MDKFGSESLLIRCLSQKAPRGRRKTQTRYHRSHNPDPDPALMVAMSQKIRNLYLNRLLRYGEICGHWYCLEAKVDPGAWFIWLLLWTNVILNLP